jgi:hypothetical protein
MDDEPNGNSPIFWIMLAMGIVGVIGFLATLTVAGAP